MACAANLLRSSALNGRDGNRITEARGRAMLTAGRHNLIVLQIRDFFGQRLLAEQ